MDLSKFWNEKVNKGHKHFISHMQKSKVEFYVHRFNKYLLQPVNQKEVDISIDWGCGGGLLAKELEKISKLIITDISEESLDECRKNLQHKPLKIVKTPNNIKKFPNIEHKIDLIHCSAVIHHFPSMQYWREVVKIWNRINPTYIIMMAKLSSKNKENGNYFKGENYINGLFLTDSEIKNCFPTYKVIKFSKQKARTSPAVMGLYVLKR